MKNQDETIFLIDFLAVLNSVWKIRTLIYWTVFAAEL